MEIEVIQQMNLAPLMEIWCPEMSILRTSKQMEIEVIQQMNLAPLMEEPGALRCQFLEHPNRWKLKSYNR